MASESQRRMAALAARNTAARATPPLQTSSSDLNRNVRYSFMETPVEMQRTAFQRHHHQLPSPANSTIEESPISPASPSRGLPGYLQQNQEVMSPPLPVEKSQAQSPQDVHPAYYAPFKDAPTPLVSHSVAIEPTPTKMQEAPLRPTAMSESNASSDPQSNASVSKIGMDRPETYNPASLVGPNGPSVAPENHRPGQVSHPNALIDPHWKKSFCEPDTLCCMGIICPCMIYGKTMYRLSRKAQKQDPTDLLGYGSCNGSCGLMALACGFQCETCSLNFHENER